MIEIESINRISPGLKLFEWVGRDKAIFRCPLCGDSKKDLYKRRGAFHTHKGVWLFSCFNCHPDSISYANFLRDYDPSEHNYFRLGRIRSDLNRASTLNMVCEPSDAEKLGSVTEVDSVSIFSNLPRIDEIQNPEHEARVWLRERRIPKQAFHKLFYVDDFAAWAEEANPNLDQRDKHSTSGILIPLINPDGVEYGYQCRFLTGRFRYMSNTMNEKDVKAFGLNYITDGDINVTEGTFDSFFLPNAIASLDGSLHRACSKISEVYGIKKERFVLWFDYEPDNKQVMKAKRDAVEDGFRVAFSPKLAVTHKDINDIVKNAQDPLKTLKNLISQTKILSGVMARMELSLGRNYI